VFTVNSAQGLNPSVTGAGKDKFRFNKNSNNMKKTDVYLVQYVLTNAAAFNLKFPQNPDNAMWVCQVANEQQANATCQNTQCPVVNEVKAIARLSDNTILAINADSATAWYVFTLNFEETGNPNYVQWDPINGNQNGGD
jgi:hypothetical protein